MVNFIANRIIKAKNDNVESGKEKYDSYFVSTSIYGKYKADVDAILKENNCEDVIK